MLVVPAAHLVERVGLVLEAGCQTGVDLQGVVVGCQLQGQPGVGLPLETLVCIQHLWMAVRVQVRNPSI